MKIGPRQIQALTAYIPTMAGYGGAGLIALFHFTEWRVVMEKVPFYGSKFPPLPKEDE